MSNTMQEKAIASYEAMFETTGILGTKIDLVLAIIRIGLFFGDKVLVKKTIERASTLVDSGGDWDRRNRLKVYQGLHSLTIRQFRKAADLFIDALSTFTATELLSYTDFVALTMICGVLTLGRVELKKKASVA